MSRTYPLTQLMLDCIDMWKRKKSKDDIRKHYKDGRYGGVDKKTVKYHVEHFERLRNG